MSEFATVASRSLAQSSWANAIIDHAFEKPCDFLIRRNGSDYEAIYGTGSNQAGKIFGNASTDVGNVINQAITQAASNGSGKIMLGTFPSTDPALVSTTIAFPEAYTPIHLCGQGPDKTNLQLANGANCNMIDISPTSTCWFHQLTDMTLNGNDANNTSGIGIKATDADGGNVSDFHITRVFIRDFVEEGINTNQQWGWRGLNCLIESCGKDGLYIVGGNTGRWLGCYFASNGLRGAISYDARMSWIDCGFESNQREGLYIGGNKNKIIGGFSRNNSQAGVGSYSALHLHTDGDNAIVLGVVFDGQSQELHGVNINAGCTDVRISQCQFMSHTGTAINDGGTRTRINGLGTEACGGGAPTAANWDIGDVVQDTDNPANHWVKDFDATFRQIA